MTAMTYGRLLDVVDRSLGRDEAPDAELLAAQAFATAWAAVGYAVWLAVVIVVRVVIALAALIARPWRRDPADVSVRVRRR